MSTIIGTKKIVCPDCGYTESDIKLTYDNSRKYVQCKKCGYVLSNDPGSGVDVRCPYCNSVNTRKISTASKAGSVALFGIFALGKTTKQWHCNDCKSDF